MYAATASYAFVTKKENAMHYFALLSSNPPQSCLGVLPSRSSIVWNCKGIESETLALVLEAGNISKDLVNIGSSRASEKACSTVTGKGEMAPRLRRASRGSIDEASCIGTFWNCSRMGLSES